MKIRLGVIGEAENIDIFREVIEEYNDSKLLRSLMPTEHIH